MANEEPTYEQLEQRVRELEAELRRVGEAQFLCERRAARVREAEQLALIGHWELDLATNTLLWSDEIYRIFDLSPDEFTATYEAFLQTVHPDDRELVNRAYTESVDNRSGYDIVHRLLLRDGTVKYVNERCKTDYDESGKPLRSLGTVQDITARIRNENSFAGIVGRDARMKEVFENIRDVAGVDAPVLIQGESGTGKELVAAAIHSQGDRAAGPFVPVNCGALPEGLLESELFGHVRGAFTNAIRDKKGRFELADGGTLFLDEIVDMPKHLQVKLLRVLQEGKLERVGDEKTIPVDVRVISAANRDLKREVEQGRFREDLYYRIKVVPIDLPPLRERRTDIPLLAEYFLEREAREGRHSQGISKAALAQMIGYPWPGNVRELQSAVYFSLIKSKGKPIQPEHLPLEIRDSPEQGVQDVVSQTVVGAALPPSPDSRSESSARPRKLDVERVQQALEQTRGNKLKAAKVLGVGRATLYRFLKNNPI